MIHELTRNAALRIPRVRRVYDYIKNLREQNEQIRGELSKARGEELEQLRLQLYLARSDLQRVTVQSDELRLNLQRTSSERDELHENLRSITEESDQLRNDNK